MFVGQKVTKQSDDEHRVKSLRRRVEFAGFIEGCRLLISIQPFTQLQLQLELEHRVKSHKNLLPADADADSTFHSAALPELES